MKNLRSAAYGLALFVATLGIPQALAAQDDMRVGGTFATVCNTSEDVLAYEVHFSQRGSTVTATFSFEGDSAGRTIVGVMRGNVLYATWAQPGATPGWARFTFGEGGTAFSGEWGYMGSGPSGTWSGTRS